MPSFKTAFWLKFSVFNLFIVSVLGLIMRYKIGFEFPYFDQKHLQESHSHFAFTAWISHTLMVLMIAYLEKKITKENLVFKANLYNKIITINLLCSFAMLLSFILTGYGVISIVFSTLSLLVSLLFGYTFVKDCALLSAKNLVLKWFKAAIFFNVISSFGTLALAYMMITKNLYQNEYLASIYYYLHFQYNGWFFFACMGLLYHFLNIEICSNRVFSNTFSLFFLTCIPTYLLSVLWLQLPLWLYFLGVFGAFVQVCTWFYFIINLKSKQQPLQNSSFFLRYILLFVAFALSLKLLLQLGSTIPYVSKLAFGFRPIVIAYLHLVLLAIITLFLLFYIYANQYLKIFKPIKYGIVTFSIGVVFNEITLAVQGIASFDYFVIPYVNELLFAAAFIMSFGILITAIFSTQNIENKQPL